MPVRPNGRFLLRNPSTQTRMKYLLIPALFFTSICGCFLFIFSCTEETPPVMDSHGCDCSGQPERPVAPTLGMLFHPRDTTYPYTLVFSGQGSLILMYPICSDSNFLSQLVTKGLTGDSILVAVEAGLVESIECEAEGFDRVSIGKGQPLRIHTIDRQ